MDIFKAFINQFTDDFDFDNIIKINKKYFMISKSLKELTTHLDEDDLRYAGLFLGEEKSKKFNASISTLALLKGKTDRWIKLNSQASWLFICGRDVFQDSLEAEGNSHSNVIVLNDSEEVIGLAKRDKKEKNIFKNFYDIGHMLRREQKTKR